MIKKFTFLYLVFLFLGVSTKAQEFSADELASYKTGVPVISEKLQSFTVGSNNFEASKMEKAASCDSLPTSYTSNNGLTGAMFNVVALQGLTIQSFYCNLSSGTSGFRIYYKTGTCIGHNSDSTAWTFLGSAVVNSLAPNTPTFIPISVNLAMNAGDTLAFYLARIGAGTSVRYKNGTSVTALDTANQALEIFQGIGVQFPFGFSISPRIWQGTINYCLGSTSVNSLSSSAESITSFFDTNNKQIELDIPLSIFKSDSKLSFTLFDVNGKEQLNMGINSGKNFISTSSLPAGVYFYSIKDANSNLKQSKLIIY